MTLATDLLINVLQTILWILTIWIPYINVGTTIALWAFTASIARNESFTVEELFAAKYRKRMGEYFLLTILVFLGTICGFMFLYVPGIVIGIAWSQATILLVLIQNLCNQRLEQQYILLGSISHYFSY